MLKKTHVICKAVTASDITKLLPPRCVTTHMTLSRVSREGANPIKVHEIVDCMCSLWTETCGVKCKQTATR